MGRESGGRHGNWEEIARRVEKGKEIRRKRRTS